MSILPYALVLGSSFLHAYWNYIVKLRHGTQVFIGLSKVAELLLSCVPFLFLAQGHWATLAQHWPLYCVGAVLSLTNYVFLGLAYNKGDLSTVYPIARAGSLVFLPLLAFLTIHERISPVGLVALVTILFGCGILQLRSFRRVDVSRFLHSMCNPATIFALLAALTTAGYSIWDKRSVSVLPPFLYFYSYTAIVGVVYLLFLIARTGIAAIGVEVKQNAPAIAAVGALNTVTYLLVLYALGEGKATYVIALRQLSIPIGTFLGWKYLGESAPLPKRIAIVLIVAGCILISFAR